ncbi:hypothetical protein MOQ_005612 [Trypanosoma cruzi marinkellei]|uniref:U2A'/phosphoprotein 32 family A C-terminal domain-containing protein n=1 Tax=Trypanosoma cruzi marinkellei TaxID=85056 RepID=K2N7D4_TRYCR|nr:hypothetical protein MOQ_005612 [Trypanosoma cruzi marinkellei]
MTCSVVPFHSTHFSLCITAVLLHALPSMLSSTAGYTRRSRVLGRRRDDTTLCSTVCPAMRTRGFCRIYAREASVRASVAAEKEKELLCSATELFRLQEEVLQNGAVADESQRTAAIESIVAELKREKSYENWSLDAAVAERMASLRLRCCPYSHRREMQMDLRQSKRRDMKRKMEEANEQQVVNEKRPPKSVIAARQRVFSSLSPLQKCVACLLWQGSFEVPQRVVCDVRRRVEAEMLLDGCDADGIDVETEEERMVSVTVFRPSLGVVDLSSIPHVVAYVSQHPDVAVIRPKTAAYFTGSNTLRFPRSVSEKEIDIGSPACAHELVEAIVWTFHWMNDEVTQQQQKQPVVLRSLTMRRCAMGTADALINALRKHQLDSTLIALDMSDNRLMSLRFLFLLRAHFSNRLLRLSLENNPITRKPEYREQVRSSLPKLTSLDGRPIRRPPLSTPHPRVVSYTLCTATQDTPSRQVISVEELKAVLEGVSRFLYVWETRRVPWTSAELMYQRQQQQCQTSDDEHQLRGNKREKFVRLPEEELDDNNFHHRYLHPSATFSMSLQEDLAFFDPAKMRLATEVETDDGYTGMRLSPLDVRDLGVFDVAMKGNSRNLLMGRSVLHRFARGSLNCYTAYNFSLYPQRLEVCHHLSSAVVSVSKITDTAPSMRDNIATPAVPEEAKRGKEESESPQKKRRKERRLEATRPHSPPLSSSSKTTAREKAVAAPFSTRNDQRKPTFYIVTIHGMMSWRAPTMKRSECILATYDRVMTFVENALPPTNPIEKRRSAPLLLFNDQVHLRNAKNDHLAWFVAQTEERVVRLVVEYGLEVCADGEALVRAVVERASSDAAASAAMHMLTFGLGSEGPKEEEEEPGHDNSSDAKGGNDACVSRHFDIFSLLSEERPSTRRDDENEKDDDDDEIGAVVEEGVPHRVTLAQVDATVAAMNRRYTTVFALSAAQCMREAEENTTPHGEGS